MLFDSNFEVPSWLAPLLDKNIEFRMVAGANKEVYLRDNDAIAISKIPFDMDIIHELKQMDSKYQQFMIYPSDVFSLEIGDDMLHFSRLSNCPGGDLFDLLLEYDHYQRSDDDFIKLLLCLVELHKRDIYLGDIKPENIMLCKCNCLAFIDLDDIVLKKDFVNGVLRKDKRYVGTHFFNPIVGKKYAKTKGMLRYADIFAWCITFMEHLLLKRFRYIASTYKKADPLYDIFYECKEETLKSHQYDLRFLDTEIKHQSKIFSVLIAFLRHFSDDLQINLMDEQWRYTTNWDKEADDLVRVVLTYSAQRLSLRF